MNYWEEKLPIEGISGISDLATPMLVQAAGCNADV